MQLSKYQQDIVDYYRSHPHDNMLIRALAGCAKTTTALELTKYSTTSDIYIAFNASIAKEFGEKVKNPKVKVKTIHALAYSIMLANLEGVESVSTSDTPKKSGGLGRRHDIPEKVTLDNLKIYRIIDTLFQKYKYSRKWDFEEQIFYKENYANLYGLCRLTCANLSNPDHINKLVHDYNIFMDYTGDFEKPDEHTILRFIKDIDEMNWDEFETKHTIDFTDMLYITYWKIERKEWQVPYYYIYTNVILDEAQDFNNLQLRFFKFIRRKNGRYVFILDENQAIYSFSGANANSFKIIPKMYAPMKEFDLPINYRCPTSHLKRVNTDFGIPIQPRPDAPKGQIKTIEKYEIIKYIKSGDMVISRKNKWLTSAILDLVSHGIPVYMQDKEMVDEIKRLVIKQKANNLSQLKSKLEKNLQKIADRITGKANNKNKENKNKDNQDSQNNININSSDNRKLDLYVFIIPILDFFLKKNLGNTVDSFMKYIDTLLNTTNPKDCVRICSVHKAKGLEADNVFVLNEAKICADARNTYEQNQQEKNLSYISITRAKNTLYLVKEPADKEK